MECENMRMPELKSLARDRGLRTYSRMRKAELAAFLLQMFCTIFLRRLGRLQTLIIFQFMKESAHQRTEEEIKFIFDHLGWDHSPIKLV